MLEISNMNIKTALNNFLDEIGNTRSMKTQRSYECGLKVFIKHLSSQGIDIDKSLKMMNMDHLIGFPAFMGRRGYSKKTIALYLSSVGSWLNWLIIGGHIEPTLQEGLRLRKAYKDANRKREQKLPRWPKKDDVDKMKKAVRQIKEPAPRLERDIAIIELLSSTGCRISEICGLSISNIDMGERSAKVVGKGNKERIAYFSQDAAEALKNYWLARKHAIASEPIFCRHDKGAGRKVKRINTGTIWNVVKAVKSIAGIENFSPHYFRHAFAIKILRETGGNLALVQDLLGHADPASTRVYAKIYPDEMREEHHRIFG